MTRPSVSSSTAGRFQGFEDAKIALIEGIVAGLLEKRPALNKAKEAVKEVFQRIDWAQVAKKAGGLALTVHTGIPMPDQIESVVRATEALLSDPAKVKEGLHSTVTGLRAIRSWARVQPMVGEMELRPYLFVAKDRKDYSQGEWVDVPAGATSGPSP